MGELRNVGDVDDVAATLLRVQVPKCRLGQVQRREQVERNDGIGEARRRRRSLRLWRTAGVVHQDIQSAVLSDDRVNECTGLFCVSDIAGMKTGRPCARSWQRCRWMSATNGYVAAGIQQILRNGKTDAARSAGYYRNFICEPQARIVFRHGNSSVKGLAYQQCARFG
jgi:hypothetical protein